MARVLHRGRGMSTTPSVWLLGWLVLGAFTAAVGFCVRVLQQATLVP